MKDPGFNARYEMWLREVREWAAKHKITETQAISVLFFDNLSGIPRNELYWCESNDFAVKHRHQFSRKSWLRRVFQRINFRSKP